MFGPDHDYKIGDDAWAFNRGHDGNMSKGTVVAILDLPGWGYRHYVIEFPSHIDPILEVRDSGTMRPTDPRVGKIADVLARHFSEGRDKCMDPAREILELSEKR